MSYSIRFSDEERKLADSYAKVHGITLGEALKNALFEKIEDEYDIALYQQAKKNLIRILKHTPLKKLRRCMIYNEVSS